MTVIKSVDWHSVILIFLGIICGTVSLRNKNKLLCGHLVCLSSGTEVASEEERAWGHTGVPRSWDRVAPLVPQRTDSPRARESFVCKSQEQCPLSHREREWPPARGAPAATAWLGRTHGWWA